MWLKDAGKIISRYMSEELPPGIQGNITARLQRYTTSFEPFRYDLYNGQEKHISTYNHYHAERWMQNNREHTYGKVSRRLIRGYTLPSIFSNFGLDINDTGTLRRQANGIFQSFIYRKNVVDALKESKPPHHE